MSETFSKHHITQTLGCEDGTTTYACAITNLANKNKRCNEMRRKEETGGTESGQQAHTHKINEHENPKEPIKRSQINHRIEIYGHHAQCEQSKKCSRLKADSKSKEDEKKQDRELKYILQSHKCSPFNSSFESSCDVFLVRKAYIMAKINYPFPEWHSPHHPHTWFMVSS